ANKVLYRAAKETGPVVVVVDPGHGGRDSGTSADNGLDEKEVTLAVARLLHEKLQETDNIKSILTRGDDSAVTLRDRVRIAQDHRANLFLSIHANSYRKNPSVRG